MMACYLFCLSALIGRLTLAVWEYYSREQVVKDLPASHASWVGRGEGLVMRINEGPLDKPPSQCWAHSTHSVNDGWNWGDTGGIEEG